MTTLSNGAPITDAGKLLVTTTTPGPTWPFLGGLAYDPVTFALAVKDAVPAAGDPWNNGIRNTSLGQMYVTSTLPSPLFYAHGLPVSADGRVFASSGAGVGWAPGGWPVAGDGGISMDGLSAQPIFWAPLLTTLVPVIAGNPTFTFQRPTSTAYVADHQGILRLASFNESRFQGARRVRNGVIGSSENLSNVNWANGTVTLTAGIADPLGGTSATSITANGANSYLFQLSSAAFITDKSTVTDSAWIRRRTGTGQIIFRRPNNTDVDITSQLTSLWQIFSTSSVGYSGGGGYLFFGITVSGDAIDVWHPQCEDVSGQSNQAPGEYVSVGVLAAPYHGNGVDGVKYFGTTNGNLAGGTNRCLWSQNFSGGSWANSNVGMGLDTGATTAPDGTNTADAFTDTATNGFHRVSQFSTLVIGTLYVFSVYVKQATLPWTQILIYDGVTYRFANFNLATGAVGNKGAGVTAVTTALADGWFRISVAIPAAAGTAGELHIYCVNADVVSARPTYAGASQTMYVWGAQLEVGSVVGPYIPTTTVAVTSNIVTEAQGTLIPTATLLGYVAENAATNLCLQSQTFDAADWTKTAATITPNTQIAPDGTMTADTLTDDATNAIHRAFITVTLTTATWTYSVYLKLGAIPWAQLNSGGFFANFNLATGAIGNKQATTTPAVVALPNGWYRCSITFPAGAGATSPMVCGILTDQNVSAPSYIGTGQTMYLWGAQVEAGSDPSSYVPTTTVAVTRNIDQLFYPAASNVGAAVGTAYAEFVSIPAIADNPTRGVLSLEAVGSYPIARTTGGQISNYDGTGVVSTVNLLTPKTLNKAATRWGAAGGQRGVILNGGAIVNAAFDGSMNGTLLQIGNWAGSSSIFGTIRNIKVYDVALIDADLIAMTGP